MFVSILRPLGNNTIENSVKFLTISDLRVIVFILNNLLVKRIYFKFMIILIVKTKDLLAV